MWEKYPEQLVGSFCLFVTDSEIGQFVNSSHMPNSHGEVLARYVAEPLTKYVESAVKQASCNV